MVETEVTEAEEKVATGEESAEEAADEALSIEDILNAIRSALGL